MELENSYDVTPATHSDVRKSSLKKFPPQPPPEDKRKYVLHTEDFNYVAHRNIEKPTTTLESTIHLIKGCLGGGILGIHEAYMKCGIWTSLVLTVVFGCYITYCVYILVKSAQTLYKRLHLTQMSYPDVAEAALEVGPFVGLRKYSGWFRYAVDTIICIDLFGACCVYQIIIAKTIKQLVENTDLIAEEGNPHLRIYILALIVPIVILCMITTLKYLAPFTLVGDCFIFICVGATIYYSYRSAPELSTIPAFKDVMGLFEFCGVVVFSMEGVGVSLPIENNMKDPSKFPLVLISGMSVVMLFMMLVGFFGYWGFGENSKTPVTLNFPADEIFPLVLKYLMAIMILITFALNFWAPFNLVWHYLSRYHSKKNHWMWERVYRATVIVAITAIAVAFPNIGNFMGLLGAFCLSCIGFIFPALIDLLVIWDYPGLGRYNWHLWKNIVIIGVGLLLLVTGTYTNLKGLVASI